MMRWTVPGGNVCVVEGPLWVPWGFALLMSRGAVIRDKGGGCDWAPCFLSHRPNKF